MSTCRLGVTFPISGSHPLESKLPLIIHVPARIITLNLCKHIYIYIHIRLYIYIEICVRIYIFLSVVCGSPARNLTFTENPEPGTMTSTHQLGSLPKGLVQVSVSGLVKLHRCSGIASPLQPTKIAFETILKWKSDKSVGTSLDIYWKSLDQSIEIICEIVGIKEMAAETSSYTSHQLGLPNCGF